MKTIKQLAVAACILTLAGQAGAAVISYPDFSSVAGLTLSMAMPLRWATYCG